MKKFLKWFTWKRSIAILFIGIGILLFIFCVKGLNSLGKDYTEEYQVYLQVKELTSSEEIRSKLKELKLEYSIDTNSITLEQYKHISFEKRDVTWQIKDNDIMTGFEKLGKEDLNEVSITGEKADDGSIREVVSCHYNGNALTKIDNNYYSNSLWAGVLFYPSIIFVFVGLLVITKSF